MKKTVIVTGASGGIGAAAAKVLAADHAVVAAYHTNKKAAEQLVSELIALGGKAAVFEADISQSQQAQALIDFAKERYGRIDLLVNCAGISLLSLIQDTTDEQYRQVFSVNMDGTFYTCRAVLPVMIAQKSGSIINISSMWGQTGASCEAVYSASKAAVIGFTKALAKEVAPSGITANCIAPGFISTSMNRHLSAQEMEQFVQDTPMAHAGTPDDVARAVRYLADDRFTTGQVLCPNGGAVI